MSSGGRNLHDEIIDSFLEEVERDDDIPDSVVSKLRTLENEGSLTEWDEITEVVQEASMDENSHD